MQETGNLIGNQKLLNILKNIKNFQNFGEEDLRAFLDLGKLRRYESGEMIILEDEADKWVYFLLSGEVKIIKEGKHINTLKESGAIFGEMGMMDGFPRSASIQASGPTLVLALDGSLIGRSANTQRVTFYFSIFKYFAKVLTKRLRTATDENIKLHDEIYKKENLLRQHSRDNDFIM